MFTPHGDFIANHKTLKMRILPISGKPRSPFVGAQDPVQTLRLLERRIPMDQLGRTQDMADATRFLARNESAFMTAVDLPVDCGRMAV